MGEGDKGGRQRAREPGEKQKGCARAANGEMVEGRGKAKRYREKEREIYVYRL